LPLPYVIAKRVREKETQTTSIERETRERKKLSEFREIEREEDDER